MRFVFILSYVKELGWRLPTAEMRVYLVQGFEEALGVKLVKKERWISSHKRSLSCDRTAACQMPRVYPAENAILGAANLSNLTPLKT